METHQPMSSEEVNLTARQINKEIIWTLDWSCGKDKKYQIRWKRLNQLANVCQMPIAYFFILLRILCNTAESACCSVFLA